MRKVELRMNELEKYRVIKDVVYGKKNKTRAEVELKLTRRQIDRLINTNNLAKKALYMEIEGQSMLLLRILRMKLQIYT